MQYKAVMKFFIAFILVLANLILATSVQDARQGRRQIASRIIGGIEASTGQFPFVANLEIETKSGKYHCAGALLSNQWVVTAGHCAYLAELVTVKVGSIHLTTPDSNRQELITSLIIIHPEFSSTTLENDIALLEFRFPLILTEYIEPIQILNTVDIPEYQVVKVLGWGATETSSGAQSEVLYHTDLAILPQAECIKIYGNQIKDGMLCAAANGNEGTCHGDMGGPLVEKIGNYYRLVGVASFLSGATESCENIHPSGFTRIFEYISWINETTGGILL